MIKKVLPRFPLLLIFILAFVLRTVRLTEVPPGLTHDEANHGREAMGILDGDFRFYFPANYGSEPVYSYAVAGSMLALGENLLALRLVNVLFGLGVIGIAYLWTTHTFNQRMALLAAGLTAVSFWPLASSREALRAGMLPFLLTLAVWFFWKLLGSDTAPAPHKNIGGSQLHKSATSRSHLFILIAAFALSIALTLHIYLAARVTWLIFPIFIVYLALTRRDMFQKIWQPATAGLLLAGLLVIPMFVYLSNHPEAQTRLTMLDGPLQALSEGDFKPVIQNAGGALLAFVWPGYGDQFLAYNIPGRPVFDGISAVFFVMGLLISFRRWRQPHYAFLLIWFGVGIIPSLLTGATANTTRNLAAMTAVYLLPAVGFTAVADGVSQRLKTRDWRLKTKQSLIAGSAIAWLLIVGGLTVRDYFLRWGDSPAVRGAYQHTLVEELDFLRKTDVDMPVVLSSIYPGPAHDPSISLVLSPDTSAEMRWVDARYALLFPNGKDGRILIPASTPLHPVLASFVEPMAAVSLRPDDLDPGFTLYQLKAGALAQWDDAETINFDDAVYLRATQWVEPVVSAGETAAMITLWQVADPARAGPIVPPFYTTDAIIFTQVLDESGGVLAQRDTLDAPSWSWQTGDIFIQIHPITIPPETAAGNYQTIIGLYDRLSEERRPVISPDGTVLDTFAVGPALEVRNP